MGMVQSLWYTVQLLKKSFLVCLQQPALFMFPLVSLLIFCLIEIIVWVIVYLRYGIHVFNADTLELWGLVSLWELSFFILFLLAPLYFLIMINMLVMQVSTAHYLLTATSAKSATVFQSISYALKHLSTILEYAWAKTIVIIGGETPLKQFIKKRAQEFGIADFLIQAKSDKWGEVTTLMVPLIAVENCSMKEMIHDSERHMKETFGSEVYATFVFTELFIVSTVLICYSAEKVVSYVWNEAVGVAVIFFILGLILTLVLMAEGLFYVSVYRYCLKQPMNVFTAEDIKKGFEKI